MDYCPIEDLKKCGGPEYNPIEWDLTKDEHEINNCYSYVMDHKKIKKKKKDNQVKNVVKNLNMIVKT